MTRSREHKAGARPKLVVGVGASAGGLEAFKTLLNVIPPDCGMAFIFVQHLDPSHKSILAELLQSCTAMRVNDAEQGEALKPNQVYIIRPDTALAVRDGQLEISVPTLHRGVRLPVDHLFRSLAREFKSRAVGIVLSGAGSDGTAGMRQIQAGGGFTIAENPDDAGQAGMPKSAIDAGVVDLILPIDEIPDALERFASLPEDDLSDTSVGSDSARLEPAAPRGQGAVQSEQISERYVSRIAAIVEARADFDLRVYKTATVQRRVLRRMALTGFDSIESYIEALREDEAEQRALLRDLLINVTDFFRDPDAFDALGSMVIDRLIQAASTGDTLRVWVPGAATGEEAYSLAILFLEAMQRANKSLSLQIFATDVDQDALAIARAGVYPGAIAEHVTPTRLERFFAPLDGKGFQVRSRLRDVVSFAVHDVCKDPPFSRMHLVSCRNLLIYLQPRAQERVLKALHFALQPDGALFLGTSESTGARRDFTPISKKWRIFRKIGRSETVIARPRDKTRADGDTDTRDQTDSRVAIRRSGGLADLARRSVLEARVPPTVVIAEDGEVLFMHGELRPYLRFPQGEPRLRVSSVVDPEIGTRVRAALYKCRRNRETVVAYSSPDASRPKRTRITATPAYGLGDNVVVLTFEDVDETGGKAPTEPETPEQEAILEQLERELEATREDLRNTVEELETSNEELRASNEESMSMNEELQSSNEELEATTEELRSLNEELTTVNSQLKDKVEQVEEANDDLSNFFASTRLATLFLDSELRTRRFTPAAQTLLGMTHADLGHRVRDIARPLLQHDLEHEARSVLDQFVPVSREIESSDGRWLIRSVLPYRTESNRIAGVVVTFTDVTDYKVARAALEIRERQQAVVAQLGPIALESGDPVGFMTFALGEIQRTLSATLCSVFELRPEDGRLLLRTGVGWSADKLAQLSVSNGLDSQPGYTLSVEQPVIVDDLGKERRFVVSPPIRNLNVNSSVSCAIRDSDGIYGVLLVHSSQRNAFSEDDANFVQAVANLIAGALSGYKERKRVSIERSVSRILFESRALEEALPRVMQVFGDELRAHVCECWLPRNERLVCDYFSAPGDPERYDEIKRKFALRELALGEGFIGEAWTEQRVSWTSVLQEKPNFIRARQAAELGLLSGFAIPITSGSATLGALAFYSKDRPIPNPRLVQAFEALGRAIGEFLRRSSAETQRERLASIVEASEDAIISRDLDGTVRSWNRGAERLFGYAAEEMLQRSADRLLPDDRKIEMQQATQRALDGKGTEAYESTRRRKDGSLIDVSIALSPLRDAAGAVSGVSAIVRDITEMKQARERLEEADRQKDHFLAMLGHELRNPLAAIRSATEIIKRRCGADETLEQAERILDRQSKHMAKLVNGILDASRIARGRINIDKDSVDVSELMRQALEACNHLIVKKELKLEPEIDGPIWVEGDPVRLTQVFDNLLSNAIKFSAPAGTIRVAVFRADDSAVLEVQDSGEGIDPADLRGIFAPFFQATQSISRDKGGLGLGLALAKGLVELHGGRIEVHSEGRSRGTLFRVILPGVEAPKHEDPSARTAPEATRILIVEDNKDAADALAQVCEMTGHETYVAYDADAAIELAKSRNPALVLCDIGLPGAKNGYDVARELRGVLDGSATLVALSGYGRPEDVEAALANGFDLHLTKPLELQRLEQLLTVTGPHGDG